MPLPEYEPAHVQAYMSDGVGVTFPPRQADCSGVRPSWYPFQMNVCDEDAPDPVPFTPRHMRIPPPPP
jgi:hypothetical protein